MREHNIEKFHLTEIDIIIARKIRERRMELGMTQQAVADKLGVTRGNITQFEMGRNKIKHNVLVNLAKILDRPITYFLSNEEDFAEDTKVKASKKEIEAIVKKWKIKKMLEEKKVSKDFIKDLALSVEYLCELYGESFEDIW